jgi:dTDP-4-dehydrorhamnose 3,5-epimerase
MKFIKTPLDGAFLIEPEASADDRGSFSRIFCKTEFARVGHKKEFVQINHSISRKKGTLRGMHYQLQPFAETKVVKCIKGAVFDVIVDIRKGSKTFLQWYGIELSEENKRMLYIPEGFAHGFQALKNSSELIYFDTNFYDRDSERGLKYDDPSIGIRWPMKVSSISDKDRSHDHLDKGFRGI